GVQQRPDLRAGDAERDDAGRVVVHDGLHLRLRLVGGRVDVALEIGFAAARVDRLAVQAGLHDGVAPHAVRPPPARPREAGGPVRVTRADMAERIDHLLAREDAVGGDELFQQRVEFAHGDLEGGDGTDPIYLSLRAKRSNLPWLAHATVAEIASSAFGLL